MKLFRSPRRRRGSSFIEVIVASALLAMLMVGVLQLFSLSLLVNQGSASRTELLYKAQQVVENLRLVYSLARTGSTAARDASGVPATLAVTTAPIYVPYYSGDSATTLTWAYWGPAGANVMDEERPPYRLSYGVQDFSANYWLITVTATPVDNPNMPGTPPTAGPRSYLGAARKLKIVTFAAQIEK